MVRLAKDMERRAKQMADFMAEDLPIIVEVEGLNHIKEAFENEGFTDTSLEKWEPRKTTDKRRRDITRYRTNRVGKVGGLNRMGQRNEGRPILTGFASGSNKLRNSFRARRSKEQVQFYTYKPYAKRHNEGENVPERQFIGPSTALDQRIEKKINRSLQTIFK